MVGREDRTVAYLRQVFSTGDQAPSFASLPADLAPLSAPLHLHSLVLRRISAACFDRQRLQRLAVNVEEQQQPAHVLAEVISLPIWSCMLGVHESVVLNDTFNLVLSPMCWALRVLGIPLVLAGDAKDPSEQTETQRSAGALLFLRTVLMFKVRGHS